MTTRIKYIDCSDNVVYAAVEAAPIDEQVGIMFIRPERHDIPDTMEIIPKQAARELAHHILKITEGK